MKKLLCILLALAMILGGIFALSSCNSEEDEKNTDGKSTNESKDTVDTKPTIPNGYTEFKNNDISFAYPSDWTKEDASIVTLTNPSGTGNNITVVYEAKNDIYEKSTEADLKELFTQSFSSMGITISNFKRTQTKNDNLSKIIKITCKTTANNTTMTQTMLIVTVKQRTYTITITETTPDKALVNNVFNTLATIK